MNITFDMPMEMRARYLNRRAEDARKLQAALRNKDLKMFFELGTQISSTAANFGFPQLERAAVSLMLAADPNRSGDLNQAVEEFADCLVRLNAELN